MIREAEKELHYLGSDVRLLLGTGGDQKEAFALSEKYLENYQNTLSRFVPSSELNSLNDYSEIEFPVSLLLRDTVRRALTTARLSDGLIDPTLLGQLEDTGYRTSWKRDKVISLEEALRKAPARKPAAASPSARWEEIDVVAGTVRRPPSLRLEFGGVGKGIAADHLALSFVDYNTWCADLGGDIRFGGKAGMARDILVPSPLRDETTLFSLPSGAVATSGIGRRIWLEDGKPMHHLLDPATGDPAWTGVVQATAVGETAEEAERLAKTALLLGPDGAEVLRPLGGALVLDSGELIVLEGVSA